MKEIRRPFVPEQGSRQPPRGMQGRTDLGIQIGSRPDTSARGNRGGAVQEKRPTGTTTTITKTQESDALVLPQDTLTRTKHDPTRIQTRTVNAGNGLTKFEKAILTFTRKHPVVTTFGSLAALGAIGAGIVEAANVNIPGIHRSVPESLPSDEVFDNRARNGKIKVVRRLPQRDIEKLDSFAKIDDHNTMLGVHPIDVSTSDKPDIKLRYKKGNGGSGSQESIAERRTQGYLNLLYFEKVPTGSTILAPVDGRLLFHREKAATSDHPFNKAVIEFEEGKGKTYRIVISGSPTKGGGMMNPPSFDVFASLKDAPAYEPGTSQNILDVYNQAIEVKKGQPIMKTAKEINLGFEVSFVMRSDTDISNLKKIGEEIVNGQKIGDIVQEPPTNLELFLSEGGVIVQPQFPNNQRLKTP